jgi:hypothetical protein
MGRCKCRSRYIAEWSEGHVLAIGSLNSNLGLVDRTWLNWRPGRDLRWKVEDRQLWRSRSVMWKAGTSKVVAPTSVG